MLKIVKMYNNFTVDWHFGNLYDSIIPLYFIEIGK